MNRWRVATFVLLAMCAGLGGMVIYLVGERAAPTAVSAAIPAKQVNPELAKIRERLGKKKYSQHDEELIVRDYFGDKRGLFFLDVGSSHYRINSTTFYLDHHLAWKGIAIDALRKFEHDYAKHRPNTKFFSYFVSDQSDAEADFYVVRGNDRLSSGEKSIADKKSHDTIKTRTITLNDLLDREGVTKVDFMSMDIELHEPPALRGFDIERFRPDLVCIEAHPPVRAEIYAYFQQHGYQELVRYSDMDPLNIYFAPKPSERD